MQGAGATYAPLRKYLTFLFLLALVSALPAKLFHLGGDVLTHMILIDCFSQQFWQGDIYPRWCFATNDHLGAPVFFFYAPLPYYAAAFLKPLGLSLYMNFALGCFLASLVTAITCFLWLREFTAARVALIGTALFLFMPYRMEVMLYRSAFSELWQMAFVPLIFLHTRRIAQGGGSVAALALTFAFSLLCHIPCTVNAIILSAAYLCVASQLNKPALLRYAGGLIWGVLLAAFYIVPAAYYEQFSHTGQMSNPGLTWPNLYPQLSVIMDLQLFRPALMMALGILVMLALLCVAVLKRRKSQQLFIEREVFAWMAVGAAALFIGFPASAPILSLLGPLKHLIFPWRMQVGYGLVITAIGCMWMQYWVTPKRKLKLTNDMVVLIAFLVMVSYFQLNMVTKQDLPLLNEVLASHHLVMPEYQSRWTDNAHFNHDYMNERPGQKDRPKAVFVQGSGEVKVTHWAWDGIDLDIQAQNSAVLKLDHIYFPNWHAADDTKTPVTFAAEEGSGQMMLGVPGGVHHISITQRVSNDNMLLMMIPFVSAGALLVTMLVCCRQKKKRIKL